MAKAAEKRITAKHGPESRLTSVSKTTSDQNHFPQSAEKQTLAQETAEATSSEPTSNQPEPTQDAGLNEMIQRHDRLWAEWDRLAKINEDDTRIPAFSEECAALEPRIVATPAHTEQSLIGKRRVAERGDLSDDFGIIDAIFELDAERIAAAG